MTTLVACPAPILQFFDNVGNPCVGGAVLTQVGGVNYPTYQDVNGTTPLPNPIPLNSRGEVSTAAGASAQCFLEPGTAYTFTLYDAAGNQLNQATYVANEYAQQYFYGGLDTGAANAYALTVSTLSSVSSGDLITWVPANTNTGASTVNVNSTGAVSIVNQNGSALSAGQIVAAYPAEILYYSGKWYLLNPAVGTQGSGSFAATLGGVAVTVKYSMIGNIVSMTIPAVSSSSMTGVGGVQLATIPSALIPATLKDVSAECRWQGSALVTSPIYCTLNPAASYFNFYNPAAQDMTSGSTAGPNYGLNFTYSLD